MTQNERIFRYLSAVRDGKRRTLTSRQAETMFGVRNLRARVHELRQNGVPIKLVRTRSGKNAYVLQSGR